MKVKVFPFDGGVRLDTHLGAGDVVAFGKNGKVIYLVRNGNVIHSVNDGRVKLMLYKDIIETSENRKSAEKNIERKLISYVEAVMSLPPIVKKVKLKAKPIPTDEQYKLLRAIQKVLARGKTKKEVIENLSFQKGFLDTVDILEKSIDFKPADKMLAVEIDGQKVVVFFDDEYYVKEMVIDGRKVRVPEGMLISDVERVVKNREYEETDEAVIIDLEEPEEEDIGELEVIL